MNLQEIKGFPNYLYNSDNGEIISKLQRKTHLKIRHQYHRTAPAIQMVQDGKRRWIFYNRLMFAIQNGIAYDDIPSDLFITKDESGEFRVIDKRGQADMAHQAFGKRDRIKYIDQKMHELEIIRRAYVEGSHIEAAQYIESRKNFLIYHHVKKYGTKRKTVEIWYSIALEKLIERIDSETSQITELTGTMLGLVSRAREKMKAELPLRLMNEISSNSNTIKNDRRTE